MIASDIQSIERRISMTAAFKKAIAFLGQLENHIPADGRVDIDGEHVFALVQRYETEKRDLFRFECHRRYIDIQYIASGKELIGWAPAGRMTVTEAYDMEKDICFGVVQKDEITPVCLREGQLAIFYPEDAHAPKMADSDPSSVIKVVVKIEVGLE